MLRYSLALRSAASSAVNLVPAEAALLETSASIHRVKVLGLPTKDMNSVSTLFRSLGVRQFKKSPRWDYAYINFKTEEAAKEAMQKLEGAQLRKNTITTEYSSISEKEFNKRHEEKRKETMEILSNDLRTPAERLADQITPLHKIPYDEQLKSKNKAGIKQIFKLKKELAKIKDVSEEGKVQIAWASDHENKPCKFLDPIGSPEIDGYRTKCDFSIGTDVEGNKNIGFQLGLYRDGHLSVLEASESLNVPDTAKTILKAMQDYIRSSEYDVYDKISKQGVWRALTTKTQRSGDVMVVVQMNTETLTENQISKEKTKLANYLTSFEGPDSQKVDVKTVLLQTWNGVSNGMNEKASTEVLTGDGYVYEDILGSRFRISSNAFFQINTPATELLYSKCAEWCEVDSTKKTTLIDVCCGTGTIGISMAKHVDRVIGIDMVPEAIVDAKFNAEMNGISNAEYYASKIEDKIDLFAKAQNEQVVAVLDPPRNGVHSSVIRALRESKQINKVIFISCDPKQALPNFVGLCRPTSKRYLGVPFKPSRAISVDLFPHTEHCELMVEFVRE
ncbi:S-adenosyl-L-methionine-dependent methyltransferase [Phycomyces nitens]|nr:S-adenosyl-L-methionine-dependent methyltransferase [Phycomyces nitens]